METQLQPKTALERDVTRWAKAHLADYDGNLEAVFSDLFQGGCQSGMVGHLIYHHDTLAYYRKHRAEIETLLAEYMDDLGVDSPVDLFGDRWDKSDPFARDTQNKNLLAWFGFEETARRLCDRAGIEI
jgi:hypothetical protein